MVFDDLYACICVWYGYLDPFVEPLREVLEAYGLGEGFLEKIGYEIRWESFSEEDATIIRSN
jgi:hypothetical protein